MELSTGTGLVILGVLYLITHVGKEWIMGRRTERMFARRLEAELESARIGAMIGGEVTLRANVTQQLAP
jgi:hypothetical protein